MQVNNVNADKALAMLNDGAALIDVRSSQEWGRSHAVGAVHLPLDQFDLAALPPDTDLIFICASGGRSLQAARLVASTGREVYNVVGGMTAWQAMGLPAER